MKLSFASTSDERAYERFRRTVLARARFEHRNALLALSLTAAGSVFAVIVLGLLTLYS